jgi:hypothetical protein
LIDSELSFVYWLSADRAEAPEVEISFYRDRGFGANETLD